MQDLKIEITLFHQFSVCVNGVDVTPDGICREFLALMLANRGKGVTAERYWRLVFKDNRIPFNGSLFTRAHMAVVNYLKDIHADEILQYSIRPMRSCSIDCDKVICDYYRMLNGEIPFGEEDDFLPEYKWASRVFARSWKSE